MLTVVSIDILTNPAIVRELTPVQGKGPACAHNHAGRVQNGVLFKRHDGDG